MSTYKYPTKELSINNAKAFINAVNSTDTSTVKKSVIIYACIGNTDAWPDEPAPSFPPLNDQQKDYEVKRDFIGARKVDTGSYSHVTLRYDWISGTVYSMYKDTTTDIFDPNKPTFYVITSQLNVYKCLNNNNAVASTIKPTGFSTLPFTTSDGYVWKYLYTVSLGDYDKFMTVTHIPVKTIAASDTSTESDRLLAVQNAAVSGAIQVIVPNTSGVDYSQVLDAAVSTATSTSLTVSSASDIAISSEADVYNGSSLYITTGTGAGQLRRIIDYVATTRTLVVNASFQTLPDTDSRIIISPTVTIIGDGQGAQAYSKLNTVTGGISELSMINVGSGYTAAKALITANTLHGSGATANVIISPAGGHGSDPVRELGADKICLNVQFQGSEGVSATGAGYVPSNTSFRTISLLQDPILKVDAENVAMSESVANTSNSPATLRLATRASISYISVDNDVPQNPVVAGDTITNERNRARASLGTLEFVTELNEIQRETDSMANALLGANAAIAYIRDDETKSDTSFYTAYLNRVQSYGAYIPFTKDDVILKAGSTTPIATVEDIQGPEANTFSGEVIYTENISTVDRSPDQTEDIKIILDF